ncbi:nicotinate-nicotinamide nucleotide adenylyltransferase [Alkanindiges sp. WGS2144]|uniref:nicotinate-nicotinamide nucleotide adenylyltransferase n=1 Tax=Alkanindiges sp. WGS2144 TaxID=3366808 RepID=UPI003751CC40
MAVFDYLVFIGRFQPFHLAHLAVIQEAFKHSKRLIILLGSAQPERSLKNVFSLEERQHMIRAALSPEQQERTDFAGLIDVFNDEKWTAMVKMAVQDIVKETSQKIGLIGHFKDQSSYYLSLFPEWPLVELDNYFHLSATPIREQYLLGHLPDLTQVPASTLSFLTSFMQTTTYQNLQQQARAVLP